MPGLRIGLLLILGLSVTDCTSSEPQGTGDRTSIEPTSTDLSSIPDVAEVICDDSGTRTTTPVVRPQRDGIHVIFRNLGGFGQFFFPTPAESSSSDLGHGGPLERGRATEATTFNGPGTFLAGCLRHGQSSYSEGIRFARIMTVDPEGLFTPDTPDCEPGKRGIYRRMGSADLAAVVRTVPGVLPTDQVLRPGYPDQGWMVEPRIVIRDDRAVALITLFGPLSESPPPTSVEWKLWVDACPDSGIGAPISQQ